jgi:predicted O-methyltransferase YrrM
MDAHQATTELHRRFELIPAQGDASLHLATALKPRLVVEVGTAFGVSGMYWLLGLRGSGRLVTFDPNNVWV